MSCNWYDANMTLLSGLADNKEVEHPLVWCLGLTFRCTPYEAWGIWSVILFYSTIVVVTMIHSCYNNAKEDNRTTRQTRSRRRSQPNNHCDGDLQMLCLLLVYFFTFAAGCLMWVLGGVHYVHPFQSAPIQLIGAVTLMLCVGLFVTVHLQLGTNWSPIPEQLEGHELVTTGLYRWARHPMYAVFFWAAIGTLLATLNWLIAWCVSGSVWFVLQRIPVEEQDMLELFGQQYAEYCDRVPPLGFPFVCRPFWRRGEGVEQRQYQTIQ